MKSYKRDFPIFRNNPELVYLDSAATSQKPQIVLDAIQDYYGNYNANIKRGLYPIAEKATQKVEDVRKKVAKFINAKNPEEIIFVRNATEGINLVMNTMDDGSFDFDTSVVVTIMEHHSNFVPWQFLAHQRQSPFEVVTISKDGQLDEKEVLNKTKKAKVLAITHVSNMLGTINPVKNIILRARSKTTSREVQKNSSRLNSNNNKPVFLVDAAQSVPHMKVDVQDLNCDFLAFSGHKTFASTGIGVLYGKKELLNDMSPFLFGGEMIKKVSIEETTFADLPEKFEAGTPDIAGIISLGAAIDYIESIGFTTIQKHEKELMAYSLSQMEKIPGLTLYGPKSLKKKSGVISFNIDKIHPHDIAQILGEENICIRAGHHCAMPLHTFLGIPASARVSFSIYITEEDVERFIKGLKRVKKVFKE